MSFDLRIRNGDIAIGSDGDLEKVEGTEKLVQEILKILITRLGSNVFYPWYGSLVSQSLVGQALDFEFVNSYASQQVQNALESLMRMQQRQALEQRVTPFEQLAAIRRVVVTRNRVDPRYFSVQVEVATRALSVTSVTFDIHLTPTL